MIDPSSPLAYGIFAGVTLVVGFGMHWSISRDRQAGRDRLARRLGSDRQFLANEDRIDWRGEIVREQSDWRGFTSDARNFRSNDGPDGVTGAGGGDLVPHDAVQ